jgi:hypothetical protein
MNRDTIEIIPYTFYGDLLGISSYYRLNQKIAFEKLNLFYNESYDCLAHLMKYDGTTKVDLISDSIVITGEKIWNAIKAIDQLYFNLISNQMLLRGAIVKGKLEFQTRLSLEQFSKKLPVNDVLARATSLEKSYKGARFIIENTLVSDLFINCPEWRSNEGFFANHHLKPENRETLQKINPTTDNSNYEMLYLWPIDDNNKTPNNVENSQLFNKTVEYLNYSKKMSNDDLKPHYIETIELIKRCETKFLYAKR